VDGEDVEGFQAVPMRRLELGVFEAGSVWQGFATIPEFFWELSLGIWLTVRGFNPSAIASLLRNSG
jgi:hypothetical protein